MADANEQRPIPFALKDIYVRSSRIRMADDFDPTIPGTALLGLFRTRDGSFTSNTTTLHSPDGDEEIKWCRFLSRFEFAYVRPLADGSQPSDELIEQQIAAEVSAEIAVVYSLTDPDFPPQEELKVWGASHAMLHVWPYWREFCHSALLRMKLPVTMIPLINIAMPYKAD